MGESLLFIFLTHFLPKPWICSYYVPFRRKVPINRARRDSRVDLAIVVLGVHDDHQVGGHIHAPAETPRSYHHLDGP